eukprot:1198502-Karenia_brevis.AAC.1
MLYNRLSQQLNDQQSFDQAGFRHGYSTDDHLYTISILQEKCHEWNIPLWCATVDFKKAFDSVDHSSLWHALHKQDVPQPYIRLLKTLYTGQRATVKTD